MAQKTCLITGITGQDGSYLAEFLLNKGYKVYGVVRRNSTEPFDRIGHIKDRIEFLQADLLDQLSLIDAIKTAQPDEVYNLAAQSFVPTSWVQPVLTGEFTALGVTRVLEAIKLVNPKIRFYQASSSEMFGAVKETPQNENTPFHPRSPYGVAKVYGHYITVNYRESYNIFACSGILFNHECVTSNTPVIIKKNGVIDILPIGELYPAKEKGSNKQTLDVSRDRLEVWDKNGFVRVTTVTSTKAKTRWEQKKIIRVVGRQTCLAATGDHLFYMQDGEKPAGEIRPGDRAELVELPEAPGISSVTAEEAMLLGMFVADGSAYISDNHIRARFTNTNQKLRALFSRLWGMVTLGYTSEGMGVSGFPPYNEIEYLSLNGASEYNLWLLSKCYTQYGFKKVPSKILNSHIDVWRAFLKGYNLCDGLKRNRTKYEYKNFKTNSPSLALALWWMAEKALNQKLTLAVEERNGKIYYSMNLRSPIVVGSKGQHLVQDSFAILKTSQIDYSGWLVDFATETGTFHAGVGKSLIHNSPRRGLEFVTRKITDTVARIKLGMANELKLGNMDAKRDWGFAGDYVKAMWMMLQQKNPDDYVIATGKSHSVREFAELAFSHAGLDCKKYVKVDKSLLRPAEVNALIGDYSKAKKVLGWTPSVSFDELATMMVDSDIERLKAK